MDWRGAGCLAGLLGAALGCGPTAMPKGAGAGGKPIAVVEKPELGLTLINRLNADQQRGFDWLHRSFADVATPFETLPTASAARLEKAKTAWEAIDFANVAEDKQILHVVRFVTTAGDYQIILAAKYVPNHARSFLALARSGYFDGAPFVLDGPRAILGSKSNPELYSLKPPDRPLTAPAVGALAAMPSQRQGEDAGSTFVLYLAPPEIVKGKPPTVVGASPRDETFANLEKIHAALKKAPDSVRIQRVEVTEQAGKLFSITGPSLPVVSAEGKLISPDAAGP